MAGPSRSHGSFDEGKKEKKRKDISGKLGKEMNDRRDEGRNYSENITALHTAGYQLSTKPETYPLYNLRLLPLTIERSAYLSQLQLEEEYARNRAELAYEEERERVEEEWRRGRDRVRERLMEGIEERRRRAREDKEGEGTSDATLDSQSRPHITRKLRNKIGTSPPPTPLPGAANQPNGTNIGAISNMPITTGPFLNPHSLSVDEIPSPYPLPLTATSSSNTGAGAPLGTGAGGTTNTRRRPKGGGAQHNAIGGLGKSLAALSAFKDADIEADLIEIRRGNKKRRAAVQAGKATAQ
ncbi:centrosomal protein atpase [Moniliophthora roreri MCA 2997]|uniref:Centrosomal protein atpase n=2 Tax=Moniliophthora roreri TaxID=221103 RepID=V2XM70_MONRO|nr:centrosomal protein atpase [Moniliophthora roreri MCA 2997]